VNYNFDIFIDIIIFCTIFWGIGFFFEWLADKVLGKEENID